MKRKEKKGIQLDQAFMAVLTLVLLAVLVIIGLVIFSSLNTAMLTPNTAGSAVNESVTSSKTAGLSATLAVGSYVNGNCGTITRVINGTGNTVIGLGNFTQSGCSVVNASTMTPWGTTLFFNYPYTYSAESNASSAANTTITQFGNYPALIGLVGTIIFLGIVIGVLVASFVFGGRREA